MKLIVHELYSELFQVVKPLKNEFIQAIRVHLYKHNNPVGSLKLEIRDNNNKVIATSNTVNISEIAGQFYHGLITFEVSVSLQKESDYRLYLSSTGYSFAESAYIGWCNSYDQLSYESEYQNTNSLYAPMSFEIWSLK